MQLHCVAEAPHIGFTVALILLIPQVTASLPPLLQPYSGSAPLFLQGFGGGRVYGGPGRGTPGERLCLDGRDLVGGPGEEPEESDSDVGEAS